MEGFEGQCVCSLGICVGYLISTRPKLYTNTYSCNCHIGRHKLAEWQLVNCQSNYTVKSYTNLSDTNILRKRKSCEVFNSKTSRFLINKSISSPWKEPSLVSQKKKTKRILKINKAKFFKIRIASIIKITIFQLPSSKLAQAYNEWRRANRITISFFKGIKWMTGQKNKNKKRHKLWRIRKEKKKGKKSYIIHEIPFAFPFLIGNGRGVKRSQMGQRRWWCHWRWLNNGILENQNVSPSHLHYLSRMNLESNYNPNNIHVWYRPIYIYSYTGFYIGVSARIRATLPWNDCGCRKFGLPFGGGWSLGGRGTAGLPTLPLSLVLGF